jgi:anti-sigma B factor antagonist
MQISTRKFEKATILDLEGKVDIHNSPKFREVLLGTLKLEPVVMVNFERVQYIDSSGIATLLEGYRQSKAQNKRFILFRLGPMVRGVLELTRLTTVFEIHESEEQALQSAGVGGC